MPRLFLACTLAVLILAPALAHADDITYTVDPVLSFSIAGDGSLTVTGTITTDGALGSLASSDIISIDLSVTQTTFGTASDVLNSLVLYNGGLSATTDGLFFSFDGNAAAVFEGLGALSLISERESFAGLGVGGVEAALSGNVEIASAPTPEPSSLILLATGALGLATTLRRRLVSPVT